MTKYHSIANNMNLADVRTFANSRGIYVSKRGRVDIQLLNLYTAAMASGHVQDYMATPEAEAIVAAINAKRPNVVAA